MGQFFDDNFFLLKVLLSASIHWLMLELILSSQSHLSFFLLLFFFSRSKQKAIHSSPPLSPTMSHALTFLPGRPRTWAMARVELFPTNFLLHQRQDQNALLFTQKKFSMGQSQAVVKGFVGRGGTSFSGSSVREASSPDETVSIVAFDAAGFWFPGSAMFEQHSQRYPFKKSEQILLVMMMMQKRTRAKTFACKPARFWHHAKFWGKMGEKREPL